MKNHVYIMNEGARAANYGIGTYIKQLVECFRNDDSVSLHIVCLRSDNKEFTVEESEAVPVIHIPNIPQINKLEEYGLYGRNAAYLLAEHIKVPDSGRLIFHFNYLTLDLFKKLKQFFPKCNTVYTIHLDRMCLGHKRNIRLVKDKLYQQPDRTSINEDERNMFESVDHIICLSTFMEDLLINDYKISAPKISLISNGLKDERLVLSEEDKTELKQRLFIPVDEKIILFVGRLDGMKGVDVLIKAFKKVVSEIPDSRLVIVGEGDFIKYFSLCEGFWHKIVFTGALSTENVCDFYRISDIGVIPSFYEQCSYVAIEMMMHGLPFIGTTAPGLDEMIESPTDKIQVEYDDSNVWLSSDRLAECIIQKLKNKETENYRSIYLGKYSLSNMYAKTKTMYNYYNNSSNESYN